MIYYSNNNAYYRAVNAQTFETIEHNPVRIRTLLQTRNPYSYSHFEIFICIYSVWGEIDQMSTNTFRYTTCCAANVYIFVYILIGTLIAPLKITPNYYKLLFPGFTYAKKTSMDTLERMMDP